MKMLLAISFFLMAALMTNVAGQCSDQLDPIPTSDTSPQFIVKKKDPDAELEKKYSHILAKLTENARFKVALDAAMDGGFSKTNDYVTFTVIENVYGIGEIREERAVLKDGKAEKEVVSIKKRCVLIPIGTKIYGLVDHANPRLPFAYTRKGKLYVTVRRLKLDNGIDNSGTSVNLKFVEPKKGNSADPDPKKTIVRNCKRVTDRPCITGRRDKLRIPAAGIGAIPTAGLLLVNNSTATEPNDAIEAVAALSFLQALTSASGIDDLVNPPNAKLIAGLIFDVETEDISLDNPLRLWIPLTDKSEAEPEKKP